MIKSLEDAKREGVLENTIYNADCLDIMKLIKPKSVDLVLTDPPYGIGCDRGVGGGVYKGKKYKDSWDVKPKKKYFNEMLRVSKNAIIFGGNFFTDMLPVGTHWIIWDKTGEIKFNNPYSDAELAWTNFSKNTIKKYVIIQAGFIAKEKDRFHPTQKPINLFGQIIRDYADGNIVLDPFLGSGTTAVACKQLGRRFIGIEIDPKYCEIAERRLAQEYLF